MLDYRPRPIHVQQASERVGSTQSQQDRLPVLAVYLCNHKLAQGESVCRGALKFFSLCRLQKKIFFQVEGKPHIQGPLVGLETIWKVPLMCRNEDVAKDAATFLVALYINLAPEIQEQIGPKSREFVDTCMTQLQNATVALRSFSESVSAKMDSTGSPMVLPTSSSTFETIVSETEATQVANRCLLLLQVKHCVPLLWY